MKSLIILAAMVAAASAGAVFYNGVGARPYVAAAAPYLAAPVARYAAVAPITTASQYHSQDELGQYSYGYAGGPSSKAELKTADGVTRGQYSYVDANGIVQTTSYVADPYNGFRVAATNIPVAPAAAPVQPGPVHIAPLPVPVADTPEVAAAKAAHFAAHAEAKARAA